MEPTLTIGEGHVLTKGAYQSFSVATIEEASENWKSRRVDDTKWKTNVLIPKMDGNTGFVGLHCLVGNKSGVDPG